MRIINKYPDYTHEQLCKKMREDPWVAARWPAYSLTTIQRDFSDGLELVRDDVRDIAMPYLARNIALSDEVIQTLVGFVNDDNLGEKLRIDAANAVRAYLDQSNKVLGTYAPKEMHISKAEVQMNLDAFVKIRKKVQAELPEVVEGELVEEEIPGEGGDNGSNETQDEDESVAISS
ncbi:MAG: hypothetical protein ACYSR0_00420 [Planctomycetota bacterium]